MPIAPIIAATLITLAAPATAEIRFTGEARMGLVKDRGAEGADSRARIVGNSSLMVEISRETDTGLRFAVTFGLADGRLPGRGPRD